MDILAVKKSYARWAPIYDLTFGAITNQGRRRTVSYINARGGDVLEVGVGTGLSLPYYSDNVDVTGVDYSREMLEKARKKQHDLKLAPVKKLLEMDARKMTFADASFDTVTAMHILSVVPDPEQVMAEIARVLKPGGQVVIVNHFARKIGFLAFAEKICAPLYNLLGWHSDFDKATIMGQDSLFVQQEQSFPPCGMMTFLVLEKRAD
ncbi:MAG: SAM-dependent methyltransferase [Rhodobacteraceae bacterium]|nr:MAG: SAM-dependent methyltransferase [Paracoccaceae bacterium]